MRNRVVFRGRVHGVGFRATARMVSTRYAVTGWVRNEPDGTVLMEAQGDEWELGGFLTDLRRTMAAFIRGESAIQIPDVEGEVGFEIHH